MEKIQITEGSYWRRKNGDVAGPVVRVKGYGDRPFRIGSEWYSEDGVYYYGGSVDDRLNLITEVLVTDKPQPTYAERHAAWVKETGIKVGDTVRITRGFEDGECGDICWQGDMSKIICKVGVVKYLFESGIRVSIVGEMDFSWPYFCLELVKPTLRPCTMEEAELHLLGAKVRHKSKQIIQIIDLVAPEPYLMGCRTPQSYFDNYTFLDGSPCGIKEYNSNKTNQTNELESKEI